MELWLHRYSRGKNTKIASRRFACFAEEMLPTASPEAKLALSLGQAEELANWLNERLFGVRLKKVGKS